ncbi:MAG: NifU family protein [Candidatus Sericytochromatia bacterium]
MVVDIEFTPNPNARKFILDSNVFNGSRQFDNVEQAKNDLLAEKLFELSGVTSVFYLSNFLTVSKDESIRWEDLQKDIKTIVNNNIEQVKEINKTTKKSNNENLQKIEEILNEYIRPGLAMDGGGLEVVDLTDDLLLSVKYHGACGGCPSSTYATLQGIMFILKENFDERIEVVAV